VRVVFPFSATVAVLNAAVRTGCEIAAGWTPPAAAARALPDVRARIPASDMAKPKARRITTTLSPLGIGRATHRIIFAGPYPTQIFRENCAVDTCHLSVAESHRRQARGGGYPIGVPRVAIVARTPSARYVVKIAYLIMAHNTPRHVQRLVSALSTSSAGFFIHVDRKSRLSDFSVTGDGVHFTKKRVAVFWGDFTQVEAILALIEAALADERRFERFVLLSGADYPLRSASEIESFFESHPKTEFINLVPMPSVAAGKPISRLSTYWLRPATPRPFRAVQRLLMMARVLPRERDYRSCFGGLAPYAGSTWWALSRDACEYIADVANRETRLVRFHRHAHCPDESFFQTILGNSDFKSRIARNLTYTDWSAGGRSPATISDRHLPILRTQSSFPEEDVYGTGPMLFARKFTDERGDLVAELDRHILERWRTGS